ncbi:hypothetical protein IFR05_000332 [Cadophora sp. M221]|nr:hypothetical protein IFR05_000332 [Cadophora sp. M221]
MFIRSLKLFVALLSLIHTTLGNPIIVDTRNPTASIHDRESRTIIPRVDASSYPYGEALPNEFQWRNWDPKDPDQKKQGEKIHQAFVEWQDFAKAGLQAASDPTSDTFKRWFGKQDNNEEIKNVFANAYDVTAEDGKGAATANVAKMICDYQDFKKRCKESTAAWTMPDSGEFHVCPYGLDRLLNSELVCSNFDDSCSAEMRSLPMTLMHEMTHFNSIGAAGRGGIAILDEVGGAYDCFKLDDDDKGDNAQNYAWLAGDAYWAQKCSKTFKDPSVGVTSTGEDEVIDSTQGEPSCMGKTQFHQEEADAAIVKFCGNFDWKTWVVVPLVSIGNEMTSHGRHKVYQIQDHYLINGGNNNLWLDVYFAQSSCTGSFAFNETICLTQMRTILNGCDTSGLFPKHGGVILDVCAVYRISASPASDPDPTSLISNDNRIGQFTCVDTDVSALGPSSVLAGTLL